LDVVFIPRGASGVVGVLLRQWFSERDWDQWDKQIETDSEAGKLDFLIKEALDEKAKGLLRGL